MIKMKRLIPLLATVALLTSCITDSVAGDAASQPDFSTEVLDLGQMFTNEPSPTATLMIYNHNSKIINLSSIKMRTGDNFRINVDGRSGREFTDVEIRPNDSIYVFVEVTIPGTGQSSDPIEAKDYLDVITNGVTRSVEFKATGQDAIRLDHVTYDSDITLTADLPYIITGELTVGPEATLTITAGATLYFHDGASLAVNGSLHALGTAEAPISLGGDRQGNVVADIPYEVMSNQWRGIEFSETSSGNILTYTSIINTEEGVALNGAADIHMLNSRIHNSGGTVLSASDCDLIAIGCQLTNAAESVVNITRGSARLDHCTLANYYLFAYPSGAILAVNEPETTAVNVTNSILIGRGTPVEPADISPFGQIALRRLMFDVPGTNDDNFIDCLWETDPMLDFDLEEYTFDYSPLPESPAIDAADPDIALDGSDTPDLHGNTRGNTLGAYGPATQHD